VGPVGRHGRIGHRGERGEGGFRGPAGPAGPQGYAGLNGLVGPIGPAGPMGFMGLRGPIEGRLVFKGEGKKDNDTDMVVRGADVYRRQTAPAKPPPPRPAPRPAPAPMPPRPAGPKYGPFQEGAAGPPPAPKPKNRRQENKEERQERRQENHGRARRAPKRDATAEEEAAHDRKTIDAAVANNGKTSERRKELAQRNRDRKAAREAAKGGVPTASANIRDPAAAGPSDHGEHQHHHTGHRKMHDDDFSTGM